MSCASILAAKHRLPFTNARYIPERSCSLAQEVIIKTHQLDEVMNDLQDIHMHHGSAFITQNYKNDRLYSFYSSI